MWLRSEVADQSHLRLTAKVLTSLSDGGGKQLHTKGKIETKKPKTKSGNCTKHKTKKFSESQEAETSSQFNANAHSESNQFTLPSSVRSTKYNNNNNNKKRVHKKGYNSNEVDCCIKSSRILEKMKKSRAARRISGISVKESIVRSRKLNAMENKNQLSRILHKTSRWHRRSENVLKDSFYENGGIYSKKNYEKAPNCSKKHKANNEEMIQEKGSYKRINSRGLVRFIQKRTGFGEEMTKTISGVSKLQRKSSFRLANNKQKCNIKCCDKKCLIKSTDHCTNVPDRLDLVNENLNSKSNVVVMSQYVNPSIQVSNACSKSNVNIEGSCIVEKCEEERPLDDGCSTRDTSSTSSGSNTPEESSQSQEKENYIVNYSPREKLEKEAKRTNNNSDESRLGSLENSCKTTIANLNGKLKRNKEHMTKMRGSKRSRPFMSGILVVLG